ncbi:MAG: hypothetical protein CSA66_01525 [Proteobacteria bacterium]|nr:MAG: hypothetical protein CSA66_01525 [Pseudomonadota bacterium]
MKLDLLTLPARPLRWPLLALLAAVAWGFGLVVRLLWLTDAQANPQAVWDGAVTLTSTDGYYWASAVQQAIEGLHAHNMRVPAWTDHAITFITVAASHLGAGVREVLLLLPGVVASLIAVPLVLIGNLFRAPLWGFAAALLAVFGGSYYSRTLLGYFDTDMFAVVVPTFVIWLMMKAVHHKRHGPAGWAALLLAAAPWFYNQIGPVTVALVVTFGGYLVLFHRRDAFAWPALAMTVIALWPLPWFVTAPLIVALGLLARSERLAPKHWLMILGAGVLVLLLFSPLFARIFGLLDSYTDRAAEARGAGEIRFEKVGGSIREMQVLPFRMTAERIAGAVGVFVAAIVGCVLAGLRYRPLLLAAPLVALGLFSQWGGLRFTIYAVPVAMLGAAYIAFFAGHRLSRLLPASREVASYVIAFALVAAMVVPQVDRALARPPATAVRTGEAEAMSLIREHIKPGDYTLAWWDFGYPLWFFGHSATLIDGGKHGADNFIISQLFFTDSQREAANLARLAVETYAERRSPNLPVIDHLFHQARLAGQTPRDLMARIASEDYQPPAATRDIYLYIPHKMLNILIPVERFSADARRDTSAHAGKPRRAFAHVAPRYKKAKGSNIVDLGRGYRFDKETALVRAKRGPDVKIRTLAVVQTTKDGAVVGRKRVVHEDGRLDLVNMRSYGSALLVDHQIFNSVLFQLYIFEDIDERYFEKVIQHPYGKVFRVKR